jgi:hypothetical protein
VDERKFIQGGMRQKDGPISENDEKESVKEPKSAKIPKSSDKKDKNANSTGAKSFT